MNIISADIGRSNVKGMTNNGFFIFPSRLGEVRDLEFTDEVGKNDILGEYQGRRFTAGTLVRESDFGSSLMTANKLHEDTVILALIAIHRVFNSSEIGIVTNLPINTHQKHKSRLIRMLEGYHTITLNRVTKSFNIHCEVAPESSGTFKYASRGSVVHGLNIGSRTVNAITFVDGMKIGRSSDTFEFGMETQKSNNIQGMAREVAGRIGAMKWKEDELIILSGGGAPAIYTDLMRYFPNVHLAANPIYLDAEGFYQIAREIYG